MGMSCFVATILFSICFAAADGHLPWPAVPHPHPQGPLTPAPPPPHFVQQPNFRIPVGPPPSYPGTTGGKEHICTLGPLLH